MKYYLLVLLTFLTGFAWSQSVCPRNSPLFRFDQHTRPRLFTDTLGHHPQFPFLQHEKGITTTALFIRAAKDTASRRTYVPEFRAFNELLKEIGFARGYKDLKAANIKKTYVNAGSIGNLGFYNKEKDGNGYIYVQLNPAGESIRGVAAWKITGPAGCYLYILHTCGNAFYPNREGGDCCREVRAETRINPLEIRPLTADRPLHIKINLYRATIYNSGRRHRKDGRGAADTMVSLIRSIDTITRYRDTAAGRTMKVYAKDVSGDLMVCRDTVLQLRPQLFVDSAGGKPDSLAYILYDTTYITLTGNGKSPCQKKWEIALDGGGSWNSIPRFDNTVTHTRTDGVHLAAELAISRIFNHWFQAGISASYLTLSYQDDVAYTGSVAGTYNTVYIGKPIIPVQLFGKFTIGGPLRWQSNISLSAGYAIPTKDQIVNSGNTLTTKPDAKGGLTAGLKLGVAYFFSCKFGVGLSFEGQYFGNKAATMNSRLMALPVTLGIRYRF